MSTISFDMLVEYNPWWHGSIEADPDLRRWMRSRVRWIPSNIEAVSLEPFSLNIIFGPRQVGKTTLIKLLIRRLIENGVDPHAIFYFRCDDLADHKELSAVLRSYLMLKRRMGIETSYIFLDEVTYPREWFRSIKVLIDSGALENDVVVVTGSLSMKVKGEIETFPGRLGKGRKLAMYPLSFRDFVRVADERLHRRLPRAESLTLDELVAKAWRCAGILDRLLELFELYLQSGGMPLAVKSLLSTGQVSQEAYRSYLDWLKHDIAVLRKDVETVKKVMRAVVEKRASPVSWLSIARDYDVPSHKTVRQYVSLLEELFVVKTLYYLDPSKGVANYAKDKKLHFTDPFFYHLATRWTLLPRTPEVAHVVEATVAAHMARVAPVYYWRDNTEIDVIVRTPEGYLGLEVHYTDRLRRRRPPIVGLIKDVLIVTRGTYSEDPPAVPACALLACLDIPQLIELPET